MIFIKNTQRSFKVDTKKLQKTAQDILDILGYSDFDVSIWLTTDKTIHAYNRDYRAKDKPTDILSFPYHENVKEGKGIKIQTEDDKNLGDIMISVAYVHYLLPLHEVSLQERLSALLIHGICHLLGYTHYTDESDKEMSAIEEKIAKKLKITL